MSPSFVARLKTMFNALRLSNSIAGIRNTGTFFTPIRVATKCLWCPLKISPFSSAYIGAMNPSLRSESSIKSSRFGSAVLGL